jgi:predicted negative regulator of RcsB-dependent stress response
MSKNLKKEAVYLLELNCKNHPSNWNVFDSLGDFYVSTGQKELAITNYKKAISLHKNKETRKKIKAITSK